MSFNAWHRTSEEEEEEEAEETNTTVSVGAVELSWDRSHW